MSADVTGYGERMSAVIRSHGGDSMSFWCPGCDTSHTVRVGGANPWGWNGNYDKPTFTPSVLLKSGHYCSGQEGKDCWCTFEARIGRPSPFKCGICHSFVTDGRIQFLGDCTHALAGQTVDLPPFDR